MPTLKERIAELEDDLKEKEQRLQELKANLDKASDLIQRQQEHVLDANELIQSWIEAFGMVHDDDGDWTWAPFVGACEECREDYLALAKKWNEFVPEYNAKVNPRPVGRRLQASEEQRKTVIKLRNRRLSLRGIAEETGLGLNTVRTIVDQRDGRDRTTMKHLERVYRDM